MIPVSDGRGYALVHSDGRITPFGMSTLRNDPACDAWPVVDVSVAGTGAVLLRTPNSQPNDSPTNLSGKIDGEYLRELIIHSQSCQTPNEPEFVEFSLPLSQPVQTSSFGWRRHPIWGDVSIHTGSDFIGPNRTSGGPALAVADGTVLAVLDLVAYGKTIVLNHGGQIATVYAHLSWVSVEAGDVLETGHALGGVGSTGLSTGVHLHFELRVNGIARDSSAYLNLPDSLPSTG
jgi:murein DD-endopeptidase MepM/ murein hydrolase activator NlpD